VDRSNSARRGRLDAAGDDEQSVDDDGGCGDCNCDCGGQPDLTSSLHASGKTSAEHTSELAGGPNTTLERLLRGGAQVN
jgi:hypothetical protein